MKERLREIVDSFHHHNSPDMARLIFGLDRDTVYDALVVAPSFTPMKLRMEGEAKVTILRESAIVGGYMVEKDGRKIAWIKTSSAASNCIDHMAVCAGLNIKKLIFVGAVGALRPGIEVGELCTPSYSIAGGYALTYLKDSIRDFTPFERVEPQSPLADWAVALAAEAGWELKRASVFCTDSIAAEYFHLEEIRSFGTDLIEMETAAFYTMAELMEKPAVALLVVSDNSASGVPLVGRSEEDEQRYDRARRELLPHLIYKIAKINQESI